MSLRAVGRVLILMGACAAALASNLSGDPPFPAPDLCEGAETASFTSLSIVKLDSPGAFSDYDVVPLVIGGQGGEMLLYRISLEGAAIPECVEFEITFEACLDMACDTVDPDSAYPSTQRLATYVEEENTVTKPHFQQLFYGFDNGALARLKVGAGGAEDSVLLWLDSTGDFVDAGPNETADAGTNDAATTP